MGYNKEQCNAYYARTIDARRKWKREWYKKNTDKVLKQNGIYQHNNLDKKREYDKKRRKELRYSVIKYYSKGEMNCKICGYNDIRSLAIDHINNDGAEKRRNGHGVGEKICEWIIRNKYPPEFQILCHNCNWIKHIESM